MPISTYMHVSVVLGGHGGMCGMEITHMQIRKIWRIFYEKICLTREWVRDSETLYFCQLSEYIFSYFVNIHL